MKQLDVLYRITTIIITQNLTNLEIITRGIMVIIIIMYIEIISSNQVSGVVLGVGERITPTDNSVSGVNYQKKIRGEEKTQNSIYPVSYTHLDVYKRQQ